ncbi:MAG: hypothetical protein AAF641_03225 [Pseudomonadota bacterium]
MARSPFIAPKRVFIIGPMTKGVVDDTGIEIARHVPNIAEALKAAYARLISEGEKDLPDIQVFEPPDVPGSDIPHEVFSHIMHCDFAVADISTKSPNVMYELAMLHANGVPVILLARDAQEIFYFNQNNCLEVVDFQVETLETAFLGESLDVPPRTGQLEHLLSRSHLATHWNPITKHFNGVHMVNVAAATGVATGNFYNFTRWVLREGGIFRQNPEFEDLVLIRPGRIKGVDQALGPLQQTFGVQKTGFDGTPLFKADGSPLLELPEHTFFETDHPRNKYFVKYVGSHLVDYPTPISSLSVSRQYLDFGRYVQENPGGLSDEDFRSYENRLIEVYFKTLEDLSTRVTSGCDWGRVKILTVPEALDYLAT